MANLGTSSIKIIDTDGDSVTVTDNRLDVNAEVNGHTTLDEGNNATISSSSATQLTGSSTPCRHVDVMAAITNTGIIYIGGTGVTASTGIALYAGDVYSLDISNVNRLYAIASVNNEDVQWVFYN